jgi:hypothetical protein
MVYELLPLEFLASFLGKWLRLTLPVVVKLGLPEGPASRFSQPLPDTALQVNWFVMGSRAVLALKDSSNPRVAGARNSIAARRERRILVAMVVLSSSLNE